MLKSKNAGLHAPRITEITKEQYRKFHTVRKLSSEAMGEHELLSYNQKKYVSKELPVGTSFLTSRPQSHPIYLYSNEGINKYIFTLSGEPLIDILRQHHGTEVKQWIDRCGGFQCAMLNLIKFCVNLYKHMGVCDIVQQGFRVSQGKIQYCWDTWMKGTYQLVKEKDAQIQNYYLSENQLQAIRENNNHFSVSFKDCAYKIGLFVIGLIVSEVKIRNYQYCQLTLNKTNVGQKLRLFQIKTTNKELHEIVTKMIKGEIECIEQIWKYIQMDEKIAFSTSSKKTKASSPFLANRSVSKGEKQNMFDSRKAGSSSKKDTKDLKRLQMMSASQFSNGRKIRLKGKSVLLDESTHQNSTIEQQKRKKPFSIRQNFSKTPNESCQKMLQYLNLHEHIIKSVYQNSIISCLESIRIKTQWKHKVFPNGSIYLGELLNQKKQGKGAYLFESQDFYYGDWNDNCMCGHGMYVFKSGQYYSGDLVRGLKQGFGKFCYQDGRVYEGNWHHNAKSGFGTILFPNGKRFYGFFQKNTPTYGIFSWQKQDEVCETYGNLQNYNWLTNQFTTSELNLQIVKNKIKKPIQLCSISQSEGFHCFGQLKQSGLEGEGMRQSLTQIYQGKWAKGKEQGEGKLVVKNKYEIKGIWEDGVMVQYLYN